jgi:hypothetical protein
MKHTQHKGYIDEKGESEGVREIGLKGYIDGKGTKIEIDRGWERWERGSGG